MSLVINHNMMAMNATRNLNETYSRLATSTRRLSSGLRVGTAADDAAGLAMRELMRADVSTLGQGLRNANDGISMIQTADGALQVIDAKLIRMKELAEQAATGTYTDVQRQMIDDEYQTMADEVTRIANDTDFNSLKLLQGSGKNVIVKNAYNDPAPATPATTLPDEVSTGYKRYELDSTNKNLTWVRTTRGNATIKNEYTHNSGDPVTAVLDSSTGKAAIDVSTTGTTGDATMKSSFSKTYGADAKLTIVDNSGTTYTTADELPGGATYTITAEYGNGRKQVDTITVPSGTDSKLTFDASTNKLATADPTKDTDSEYTIETEDFFEVDIHFGSANETSDHYSCQVFAMTAYDLGLGQEANNNVATAENAKKSLTLLTEAIRTKDNIRAGLGAMQNRLSATIENVSIQRENLQASESRISDVDVATEMTEFTRNQVMSQAAVAMLAQANSLPKMAQKLLDAQ